MTPSKQHDSTEIMRSLERKRRALQEIINLTQMVEHLQDSLQAVMLLGKGDQQIPKQATALFKNLDERLRGHPASQLEELLQLQEDVIRNDLAQIMQMVNVEDDVLSGAKKEETDAADDAARTDVLSLVEDFRTRVHTAIFIRVLIREQGASTKPLALAVSTEKLEQQIAYLDERHRSCRDKLKARHSDMLKEINQILISDRTPDIMVPVLRSVQDDLKANLAHLEANKPVETMPYKVEEHLLSDLSHPVEAAPSPTPVQIDSRKPEQKPIPTVFVRPRGFLQTLWLWLTTPTSVGWRVIRSGKYIKKK